MQLADYISKGYQAAQIFFCTLSEKAPSESELLKMHSAQDLKRHAQAIS